MPLLWILLALAAVVVAMAAASVAKVTTLLEPPLTPGGVGEARDPEFFALQAQSFAENGYRTAGDFVWHDGLTAVVMRAFLETAGQAYGWATEQAVAGVDRARRSVSVLTEFTDGTLLDTTSVTQTGLAIPPWFLRESVPPDTERLLRRHRERRTALIEQGKEIVRLGEAELLETIRRNERRLGEYQVRVGRMRLAGGKLHLSAAGVFWVLLRGSGRIVGAPFRRGGA